MAILNHQHHEQSSTNIKMAFFLNLGFTLVEIIGGLWTKSLAILSDAVKERNISVRVKNMKRAKS